MLDSGKRMKAHLRLTQDHTDTERMKRVWAFIMTEFMKHPLLGKLLIRLHLMRDVNSR